jgi:hypothetical protein
MTARHLMLTANALLAGGLMASFVAGRLRVPSLVLFLGIGMLVGTDALGFVAGRRVLRFSLHGFEWLRAERIGPTIRRPRDEQADTQDARAATEDPRNYG